jgi:hypothetical protein
MDYSQLMAVLMTIGVADVIRNGGVALMFA